jgi:hypothetical protein
VAGIILSAGEAFGRVLLTTFGTVLPVMAAPSSKKLVQEGMQLFREVTFI